ncbi:MAG: sigma-70 family RNA polymerase sigma factor [Bacteroidales bacterium]|nr:sigma-70 family RNA polymerase sigma factor [Bacteroidales bacterium]
MQTTSTNLLLSLRHGGRPEAWARFVRIYSPLLYSWACRIGLQEADALDLVQDVFITLLKKLPEFDYDSDRGFREWLWVVTRNRYFEIARRKRLPIDRSIEPDWVDDHQSTAEKLLEEKEFRHHMLVELVPAMADQFQASTWKAFWRTTVDGCAPADVAAELGLSSDAVYKARARVLARLHREFADLLD